MVAQPRLSFVPRRLDAAFPSDGERRTGMEDGLYIGIDTH